MSSATSVSLQSYFTCKQRRDNYSPQCVLQWRQGQLLVKSSQNAEPHYLPSVENEQWLVSCLQHSPVSLVRVDAALGEAEIQRWADASEQAKKPIFLWGAIAKKMPKPQPMVFSWWVKRLIDWMAALLLLIALSPVMLAVAALMYVYSRGAIFSFTWHVGGRGKLFRVFRFRTKHATLDDSRSTSLGRWIRRYRLDELPGLFNVLHGEMSLLGQPPLSLYEAVRLSPEAMTTADFANRISVQGSLAECGGTNRFVSL